MSEPASQLDRPTSTLRQQILHGGAFLVARQGAGLIIGAVGIVLLTRIIGPKAYGLCAASLGITQYIRTIGLCGLDVYLIRREGKPEIEDYHQAFTLLLVVSVIALALAFAALPTLESWMRLAGLRPVAIIVFAGLPLNLLGSVPTAYLERRLEYRKVAAIGLASLLLYQITALSLALRGAGAMAPAVAWLSGAALTCLLQFYFSGYRPRLCWRWQRVKTMVGYGIAFSASLWVLNLRGVLVPMVLGRLAGAEAVGYVALCGKLVDTIGFVKTATWRLSMSALARMQNDTSRLLRAINEGMRLQVISLGPLLAGFGLLAPWIVPAVLGPKWHGILRLYPFIAVGALANAIFCLHSSALYVLRENFRVAVFHAALVGAICVTAMIFVPSTRLGMTGYGVAEIAALASYLLLHVFVVRKIGRPDYAVALVWGMACAAVPFWPMLGYGAFLPLAGALLWPRTWHVAGEYTSFFWRSSHGPAAG